MQPTPTQQPRAFYSQRIAVLQPQLSRLSKWSAILSAARLVIIIAAAICIYRAVNHKNDAPYWLAGAGLALVIFLVLVYIHAGVAEQQRLYRHLLQVNINEAAYLDIGALPFADGAGFARGSHAYTSDLDIFGKGSLFHHLNRTVTHNGQVLLAGLLEQYQKELIVQRQQAIQELAAKAVWRQQFAAYGMTVAEKPGDIQALEQWLDSSFTPPSLLTRVLMYLLPAALAAVLAAGSFANFNPWPPLTYLFVANLFVTALNGRSIRRQHALLNRAAPVLATRASMLRITQEEIFESSLLRNWQAQLLQPVPAAKAVQQLAGLLERFDRLFNIVASPVTNGLFQYHNHALVKLYRWKQQHGAHTRQWLHTLAEFDAAAGMANFAFNNPAFVYPVLNTAEKCVQADAMGHPLIPAARRVCNSIHFNPARFYILTGSNMAGKSTFLRTIGINLVMANAGLPVCAAGFAYYPFELFTSMRIDDSLIDSESYFYAELKRLRQLITGLAQGTVYFVLLDEVLRGTNSEDKYSGTVGLLHQLMRCGAWGILATHDVKVSLLEADYPGQVNNICFEAGNVNGQLQFDYLLRPGVSAKKSATQLMLQMGIIPGPVK